MRTILYFDKIVASTTLADYSAMLQSEFLSQYVANSCWQLQIIDEEQSRRRLPELPRNGTLVM